MPGRILRLSVKPETAGEPGLPKRAVPSLRVTSTGAEGDFNRYRTREMPGDLDQAVLLLTREVLDQLGREGWPVEPGDLGENVTLGDVPESALGPGVRLRQGEVELEITKACDPCTETYTLPYVGQERGPGFVRTLVGRRGWYARVLKGGVLTVDQAVDLSGPPA
jgi:MOSC domain-containing protein YiiM